MKNINRREFMKGAAKATAAAACTPALSALLVNCTSGEGIHATIPLPIQVVIDDVGWWSGHDGHEVQEPYRTGIARNHVPADYLAIVELGRSLGVRPQAAMILCEWDMENILRRLPTSTWMGSKWDNKWVGPWLEKSADIIRSNARHFEFTMHGIGHEYWSEGKFTRAEWADRNGRMRPRDQVEAHLDFFEALMKQHDLGPFPKSFVPTAFLHGFGPTESHEVSLAEILSKRGISYINTPFDDMFNAESVDHGLFGIDAGVITIDRGRDLLSWKSIGELPEGELKGPTCGLHWPNLLHPDPERNAEIVRGWASFLKPYNDRIDTMLAPNSDYFQHQLVHHLCTKMKVATRSIRLDFTEIETLPYPLGRSELTMRVASQRLLAFSSTTINIVSAAGTEQGGRFVHRLVLRRISGERKIDIEVAAAIE